MACGRSAAPGRPSAQRTRLAPHSRVGRARAPRPSSVMGTSAGDPRAPHRRGPAWPPCPSPNPPGPPRLGEPGAGLSRRRRLPGGYALIWGHVGVRPGSPASKGRGRGAGQASFANTFQTQDSATPLALGRGSPVGCHGCQRGAETRPRGRLAGGPGGVRPGRGGNRHRAANRLTLVLSLEN